MLEIGYEDTFIDYLIHSQYQKHPISEKSKFPNEKMTQYLTSIIEDNKDYSNKILFFLENNFYIKDFFNDKYNSHKKEVPLYRGYWSIETATLVKVMNLDDSSFKNNVYYPYDLVHWQDGKE